MNISPITSNKLNNENTPRFGKIRYKGVFPKYTDWAEFAIKQRLKNLVYAPNITTTDKLLILAKKDIINATVKVGKEKITITFNQSKNILKKRIPKIKKTRKTSQATEELFTMKKTSKRTLRSLKNQQKYLLGKLRQFKVSFNHYFKEEEKAFTKVAKQTRTLEDCQKLHMIQEYQHPLSLSKAFQDIDDYYRENLWDFFAILNAQIRRMAGKQLPK